MKINFLLPFTSLTGGIKVILEHANGLSDRGHQITLIYPIVLSPNPSWRRVVFDYLKSWRRDVLSIFNRGGLSWFPVNEKIKVIKVGTLAAKNISCADICVATANETADWLVNYPVEKGEKFYFIQDYETWTREADKVDATWKMPLKKIVIASWLKDLARDKFNQEVVGVVPNGIDLKIFNNSSAERKNINPKVLMLSHRLKKKGMIDGIVAFNEVKKKYPDIKLEMFGFYKPKSKELSDIIFHHRPSPKELAKIYRVADIFLWPSWVKGFGLPPLEAMACGCSVISTDTGAIREYAQDNESVIIVPPKQPEKMTKALLELLSDEKKRMTMSRAATEKAKEFSRESSTEKLERIFLDNK